MRRHRQSGEGVFEAFSDMAMLMLAAFVFLFALILMISQLEGAGGGASREEVQKLKAELSEARKRLDRLEKDFEATAGADVEAQTERILAQVGLAHGKARKDFDLFVEGIKRLPGHTLHLVVDATGSMHGATLFLLPVLRVIAIRSGKKITAVSWFADGRSATYQGRMAEMFDMLMQKAPFIGADETIGHAFRDIAKRAPIPSAYLLIGDEPPTDTVHYAEIPAPVFTLPFGTDAPAIVAYERIARETGGRMLRLRIGQ